MAKAFYTDYKTAVHWCGNSLILCNDIEKIDENLYDEARFNWYDEETDTYTEIFQYFLTDCSLSDVEYLEKTFEGILFTYSNLLDLFVLCVDHLGTPWDGVRIKVTNDTWIRCNKDKEYKY